jgi:hypothetical protein
MTTDRSISEAASKKRGRPRLEYYRRGLDFAEFDAKTERGRQDVFYRLSAVAQLKDDERFTWLCDKAAMVAGKKDAWKPSILTELGRIESYQDLVEVALEICKIKPKTKDAIAMIRRWRTGCEPASDADKFWSFLAKEVNKYARQHPSFERDVVVSTLRELADHIERDRGGEGAG